MQNEYLTNLLGALERLIPLSLGLIVMIAVGTIVIRIVLNVMDVLRIMKSKHALIELTPPAGIDSTALATQRLFSVLHGMRNSRSMYDKMLRRRVTFAVELVGTRDNGIRYVIRVPENDAQSYEKAIASYMPETKFKKVDDYMLARISQGHTRIVRFKQTGHFAYPLATQDRLDDHDPVGYLNGTMTKLKNDEMIVFQMVVTPTISKDAIILQNRLMHNEELVAQLGKRHFTGAFLRVISAFWFGVIDLVGDLFHGPSRTYNPQMNSAIRRQEAASKTKPVRTLSVIEQGLADSVSSKLERPLFAVDIRATVNMSSSSDAKYRVKDIRNALDAFSLPKYQSLKAKIDPPFGLINRYHKAQLRLRLPSVFNKNSTLLSDTELSGIYHFPNNVTARTENVIKSLSRQLPAPVSLKNGTKLDVILGRNYYHGQETDIGLTEAERERHLYIIGGTGNGKTTMLFYSILQDIRTGKGVAVLDPHGDLAERILRYIPTERIADVIYMNPDDLAHPIGVNLLELPEGLEGDDLLREKDRVTEATISVLRKIFSDDDSGGHRIEYVLRNSIQTVLTLENPTLFTIFELLNDAKFRRSVVKSLADKNLKDFWDNELGKAGEFQRVKMAAGITAKIGRFLFSASAKRVLEQPKSTINFEEMLASQKILICNFSKGLIGEDTSALFGTTILAKLQTAALRRAKISEQDRVAFFVYVDEFQNFATMSFVQMLSEARKYKLFLTMAEQSTSQQDQQRLVDIILANVGSIVCFRSGSPADERLVLPLFSPFIEQGEIANLPAYSYFARIAAINAQEPMSGMTVVINEKGSEDVAKTVIESSRRFYARKTLPLPASIAATEPKKPRRTSKRTSKNTNDLKSESSLK